MESVGQMSPAKLALYIASFVIVTGCSFNPPGALPEFENAPDVRAAKHSYERNEGPHNRGKYFAWLVTLATPSVNKYKTPITEEAFFRVAGTPDFFRLLSTGVNYLYFYTNPNGEEWVAYVTFSQGVLESVGINGASVNDHTSYVRYTQ